MPRENGQVVVVKRFITSMLTKVSRTPNKWDSTLYEAEFTINNTLQRSTGQTLNRLLFRINQLGDVSNEIRYILAELDVRKIYLSEVRDRVIKQIVKEQVKHSVIIMGRRLINNI